MTFINCAIASLQWFNWHFGGRSQCCLFTMSIDGYMNGCGVKGGGGGGLGGQSAFLAKG